MRKIAGCVSIFFCFVFLIEMCIWLDVWSGLCDEILNISMPYTQCVNEYLEKDDNLTQDVINELYPGEQIFRMSYNNSGNETDYYVETASDNIYSYSFKNTEIAQIEEQNVDNVAQESEVPIKNNFEGIIHRDLVTGNSYTLDQLKDYNFSKKFYTVTSITDFNQSIFRPAEFLEKDMKISHDSSTPQILIFHTHSQEGFKDSVEGDYKTSIVGVGEYLASILTEKYGYNVIHDKSVYDYVDGKLDRSKAYTYAENSLKKILDENPSVDVVIDLHRDGVDESTHLVSEIDGKQTAKIMFFNGISYSKVKGDIGYLYNPYRDDNLAMSFQMNLLGQAYYPGWLRNNYINAYRYCLHERGKSMLIEAGAQTNTIEEVNNAMEPLADLLDKLLRGQKAY